MENTNFCYNEYENEINKGLINKILKCFKSKNGISSNEISTILNIKEIYITKLLSIMEQNFCTFFSLGRVGFDKSSNLWFYINSDHPNSRKKNIFDNNLIINTNTYKFNNNDIIERIKFLENEISRLKLDKIINTKNKN